MPATRPQELRSPWPERTVVPTPAPRRRSRPSTSRSVDARQVIADQSAVEAAQQQCEVASGNEVISCFPTADVVVVQGEWASFVWNSNNPNFVQSERVDIYLFHGDSLEQVLVMPNQVNTLHQSGVVRSQVDDTWWGARGANWAGTNISYPFYWLIARHNESLDDGTLIPQATFSAVQTTFANSVLSSMSSASASRSSASAASAASLTALSTIGPSTVPSPTPAGSIQSASGSGPFPHWAIVVIVLGIVCVASLCGLMLFAIYCLRRKEERDDARGRGVPSRVRSRSPSPSMAQTITGAPSVVAPVPVAAAAAGGAGVGAYTLARNSDEPEPQLHAGPARTTSPTVTQRTVSPDSEATHSLSGSGHRPFSGADAAIMASAFRAGLRSDSFRADVQEEEEDGEEEGR